MRGSIIARIPADNGRVINIGGSTFTVGHMPCESDCDRQADVIMQGETDSFGFEPIHLCQQCADRIALEERTHSEALDVEDREPMAGHLFLVAGGDNMDRNDWCMTFQSFRKATAFLRRCVTRSEPYGGIYPRSAECVRELPADEAKARERRYDKARQEELFDDEQPLSSIDDEFEDEYDYGWTEEQDA